MFNFSMPTCIHAGDEALSRMIETTFDLGPRVLVVTDPGIVKSGLTGDIVSRLDDRGCTCSVFDQVVSNPTIENVDQAFAVLEQSESSVIVAVGGGSAMDTAKGVALLATNDGPITNYEGLADIPNQPMPLLTVPTTVGTGAEVSNGAVLTESSTNRKIVVISDRMYPTGAFLDPVSVASLPAEIAAATGMDALTHAIEAYVCRNSNEVSDALAISAIEIITRNLLPAWRGDRDSLFNMLVASCMAGTSFLSSGLGLVHGFAMTIGGHFKVHHGEINAVLLPWVIEFNQETTPAKFARISTAMNTESTPADVVRQLLIDLQLPRRLRDLNIPEDALSDLAVETMSSFDRSGNPRESSLNDLEYMLQSAW